MRIVLATRFVDRIRGLHRARCPDAALLIAPCWSIHTFGMPRPIDVAFVGRDGTVLRSERAVRPGRIVRCPGAQGVLEAWHEQERAWFCVGEEVTVNGDDDQKR